MAAEVQHQTPGFHKQAYQTTRSKARPKHTLFGSALEQLDEADKQQITSINIHPSNSHRTALHPGLQCYKQELDALHTAKQKACTDLKDRHQKAVSFQTRDLSRTPSSEQGSSAVRSHQWYKPDDLYHAEEINRIGLNSRQSFNYDKYGSKPPVHKYALIGDIMRKGMDFNSQVRTESAGEALSWRRHPGQTSLTRKHSATMSSDKRSVIDLPVNIKHLYGTKVCDSLLNNSDIVNGTLECQAARDLLSRSSPRNRELVGSPLNPAINPSYEALGNISRQNIFPGYSMNYTKSLAKSSYTNDVHNRRVPPPDKFRYRRDELSSWSEYNFIRSRLQKKWEEYMATVPKVSPNWDRTLKREIIPKKTEVKPKPKKKVQEVKKKEPVFDEIVFKTPPLTPPPPPAQPSPAKLPDYIKDDDFWEFFDQAVP